VTSIVVVKKKKRGLQKKPLFIIISKAAVKTATKRNLLKRQIKAITHPFLFSNRRSDFCIIVKKGADMVSFENLKREVLQTIEKK